RLTSRLDQEARARVATTAKPHASTPPAVTMSRLATRSCPNIVNELAPSAMRTHGTGRQLIHYIRAAPGGEPAHRDCGRRAGVGLCRSRNTRACLLVEPRCKSCARWAGDGIRDSDLRCCGDCVRPGATAWHPARAIRIPRKHFRGSFRPGPQEDAAWKSRCDAANLALPDAAGRRRPAGSHA